MRVRGIDPDNPPEAVKPIFERSRERYGRVISPHLAAAAVGNFRARFNCALKVQSDNLCMLPPDHPVRQAAKE